MNFLKSKFGIFIMLLGLIALIISIWYCFGGCVEKKMPEGTLVFQEVFHE